MLGDKYIKAKIMTKRLPFVGIRVVHVIGVCFHSSVSLPSEVSNIEQSFFALVQTETKMACAYVNFPMLHA